MTHGRGRSTLWGAARVCALGGAVLAGLLFWSRLKVVTDTPRSAYAVPGEEKQAPHGKAPDADAEGDTPAPADAD